MARKRKADHETAIAASLELFWQKGYEGASTREIEEKTGLTRFTLQTSYGGKEGFFLDTLDAYIDRAEEQHFPDPANCDLIGLANWFESLTAPGRIPLIEQTGCLAFNSIADFGRENTEINKRIERYLNIFTDRIEAILQAEKTAGTLTTNLDISSLTNILLNLLLGLHVTIKARTNDQAANNHAAAIGQLIRGWRES